MKLPNHEIGRYEELRKMFPNSKISYFPSVFPSNNLDMGTFMIGEPKDPREPLGDNEII